MPDAHGNFKGMAVPAAAWERIFGKCRYCERQPIFHEGRCADCTSSVMKRFSSGVPANRDKPPIIK